jgi:hypothetical protein
MSDRRETPGNKEPASKPSKTDAQWIERKVGGKGPTRTGGDGESKGGSGKPPKD